MDREQPSSAPISFFWGIPALVWQVLFFYVPLSFLISTSFVKYSQDVGTSRITFEYYAALFRPVYGYIILRSVILALTTVVVCFCIAYPVAYFLVLRASRWKTLSFALLVLPFWTNFLLLVYSWYFLLENDGLVNSLLLKMGLISAPLHMMNTKIAVYCGMFYCYLPFMLLPLYSVFTRFNTQLVEASQDLGATYSQTFFKIIFPLTIPGIQTGALLVFVPAFGEFVIPALLGGDKEMYIGSVISHYFLTVRKVGLGSAFTCFCALILIGGLLSGILVSKILFKKEHYGEK